MKNGAYDYLPKPFEVDELRLIVEKVFEPLDPEEENRRLRRQLASSGNPGSARVNRLWILDFLDILDFSWIILDLEESEGSELRPASENFA